MEDEGESAIARVNTGRIKRWKNVALPFESEALRSRSLLVSLRRYIVETYHPHAAWLRRGRFQRRRRFRQWGTRLMLLFLLLRLHLLRTHLTLLLLQPCDWFGIAKDREEDV